MTRPDVDSPPGAIVRPTEESKANGTNGRWQMANGRGATMRAVVKKAARPHHTIP